MGSCHDNLFFLFRGSRKQETPHECGFEFLASLSLLIMVTSDRSLKIYPAHKALHSQLADEPCQAPSFRSRVGDREKTECQPIYSHREQSQQLISNLACIA